MTLCVDELDKSNLLPQLQILSFRPALFSKQMKPIQKAFDSWRQSWDNIHAIFFSPASHQRQTLELLLVQ